LKHVYESSKTFVAPQSQMVRIQLPTVNQSPARPSRTPNGRKKQEKYLYSHFSPLVDTIGKQKPAVKQVFKIFSLWFRDLACFVDAK
jgi:hypothetical protein